VRRDFQEHQECQDTKVIGEKLVNQVLLVSLEKMEFQVIQEILVLRVPRVRWDSEVS